jgi:hypothetical protein
MTQKDTSKPKGEFPSKENQFSSTNQPIKRGRNKGSRNVSSVLKDLLSEQDKQLGGVGEFGSPVAQMLLKIAFGTESSDESKLKAIREILDRIEGKVEQNIRVGSTEPTWIAGTDTEEDAQE